jgi:hypothetical protein
MTIEDRLENIEKLLTEQKEVVVESKSEYLSAKEFSGRIGIGYGAVRRMINERLFPYPVHFVAAGNDKINMKAFDEWILVTENAEKLGNI